MPVELCIEGNKRSRKRYYCLKRPKINIATALGDILYENHGGQVTGPGGGQTVVSMRCAANQRKVVCQSNYALKAMNGAGNDLVKSAFPDLRLFPNLQL